MTTRELTTDQLEELRSSHFYKLLDENDLGNIDEPSQIPMEEIHDYYGGTYFVNDDFFCSIGEI